MRSVNLLLQVAVVSRHFSPAGSNMGFTRATRPQDARVIDLFKYNPEGKAFLLSKRCTIITEILSEHIEIINN